MFGQLYPVLLSTGVLSPCYTQLDIDGVTNRQGSALAAGNVVEFDLLNTATESVSYEPGALYSNGTCGSVWGNVIRPVANTGALCHLQAGVFGIALEAIADDATGKVRVVGLYATAATVTAAPAAGACLCPKGGAYTLESADPATGLHAKIIAIATAAGTGNVTPVFFNGFGFGHNSAPA